jgi:hypothetical protein
MKVQTSHFVFHSEDMPGFCYTDRETYPTVVWVIIPHFSLCTPLEYLFIYAALS